MSHDTGFPTWRLVAGVVVTGCLLLSFAWAADQGTGGAAHSWQKEIVARVGAVQGDTKVQRAGEAKFKKIAVKAPLYVMDFLATGKNSKLWWHGTFNAFSPSEKWKPGPDVTEGSLAADSVFGFKQFTRAGASYRFVGYVQKGTVRFIKTLPNTNPPSTFTIGTHTAWIEVLYSDRAADFIVESKNESLTTVTVLWGKVRVRNISPQTKESRVLTSCQEVDVERDQEPGDIKWVSTDTMKELVKRTTIPRTLPDDVPSCERLKTEVILEVTDVFLPPPGVALFPVVPVPVRVPPGKKDCCPPGQMYDPRTGKCRCPCPEGELPPVTVLDNNGSFLDQALAPCGSCRNGATFNPETCSCECPCPQGFLLPGRGCVPQCPEGYSETYDASSSPPYRCRYCVQTEVGTEPLPPPLRQCQDDAQCDHCEGCIDGTCVPRVCKTGFYLDRGTCQCLPIADGKMSCTDTEGSCPQCQRCVNGTCQRVILCQEGYRLNQDTCQCEPVDGRVPRGCQSQADCSSCTSCIEGRCLAPEVNDCPALTTLNPVTCQCDRVGSKLCPDIVCGPEQRLNVDTCQCESRTITLPKPERPEVPEIQHGITNPNPECQANSDCAQGEFCHNGMCQKPLCRANSDCAKDEICRNGKCVKKPPPRRIQRPPATSEPLEMPPNLMEESSGSGIPSGGFSIGGGVGVGGQSGGVQRVPRQGIVPRTAPQRIKRGVGPN
jgi:hypothetical protein